jgi:hypothetical protein
MIACLIPCLLANFDVSADREGKDEPDRRNEESLGTMRSLPVWQEDAAALLVVTALLLSRSPKIGSELSSTRHHPKRRSVTRVKGKVSKVLFGDLELEPAQP